MQRTLQVDAEHIKKLFFYYFFEHNRHNRINLHIKLQTYVNNEGNESKIAFLGAQICS